MSKPEILSLFNEATRRRIVEREYARGDLLFRRGDSPKFVFYILEGEARLVRHSPTGMEVIFQRTREGFLAEASVDQPAYHCDGVAVEASRALLVPISDFRAALADETISAVWFRHMSNELRRVRAHAERLALRTARDRILHYIESEGRNGVLVLQETRKSWASELGLTHEALYRVLRAMERKGILDLAGGCIALRGQGAAPPERKRRPKAPRS